MGARPLFVNLSGLHPQASHAILLPGARKQFLICYCQRASYLEITTMRRSKRLAASSRRRILWPTLLAIMPCAAELLPATVDLGTRDLLQNGGFEKPITAEDGVPGWHLATFGKSPAPLLERHAEQAREGSACLRMGFPQDGWYSFSLFQRLDGLDVNDRVRVTFWYCVVSVAHKHGVLRNRTPVPVQISKNPGGKSPTMYTEFYWLTDGKWHKVEKTFDLRGMTESSVLEVRINSSRSKTDVLLIDGVSLAYVPKKTVQVDIVSPANYTLHTDDPSPRQVEFVLHAPGKVRNG